MLYLLSNTREGFPVGSVVKNLPAMGHKDPLEKEMATHSSPLAWEIPWMEEPSRLESMGSQRADHDSVTRRRQPRNTRELRLSAQDSNSH